MATPTPAATPVEGTRGNPSTPHQESAPEATPGTQGSSCPIPPASPCTSCDVTMVPATQTETPTAANLTPPATQGYSCLTSTMVPATQMETPTADSQATTALLPAAVTRQVTTLTPPQSILSHGTEQVTTVTPSHSTPIQATPDEAALQLASVATALDDSGISLDGELLNIHQFQLAQRKLIHLTLNFNLQ